MGGLQGRTCKFTLIGLRQCVRCRRLHDADLHDGIVARYLYLLYLCILLHEAEICGILIIGHTHLLARIPSTLHHHFTLPTLLLLYLCINKLMKLPILRTQLLYDLIFSRLHACQIFHFRRDAFDDLHELRFLINELTLQICLELTHAKKMVCQIGGVQLRDPVLRICQLF